jgi:hypothetical protein
MENIPSLTICSLGNTGVRHILSRLSDAETIQDLILSSDPSPYADSLLKLHYIARLSIGRCIGGATLHLISQLVRECICSTVTKIIRVCSVTRNILPRCEHITLSAAMWAQADVARLDGWCRTTKVIQAYYIDLSACLWRGDVSDAVDFIRTQGQDCFRWHLGEVGNNENVTQLVDTLPAGVTHLSLTDWGSTVDARVVPHILRRLPNLQQFTATLCWSVFQTAAHADAFYPTVLGTLSNRPNLLEVNIQSNGLFSPYRFQELRELYYPYIARNNHILANAQAISILIVCCRANDGSMLRDSVLDVVPLILEKLHGITSRKRKQMD